MLTLTPSSQTKEFDIGITLVREKKFMEALDRFKLCIDMSDMYLPLIQIELFKKLHLDIDNLQLRIVIIELFIYCQRYGEAILEIEDMVSIDVNYTQSYFILGRIYSKVSADEKMDIKAIFEHAFHSGVSDISVLDLLATIYFEAKEYEKSIHLFERLIEIRPQSLHYLKTLSELYRRMNMHDKSALCYEKLCQLSPDYTQETIPKIVTLVKSKDSVVTRLVLVKLYARTCDIDNTVFEIKKLVNNHPSAGIQLVDVIDHVLSIFPEHIDLMQLRTKALFLSDQYIEGLTYLKTHLDTYNNKKDAVHLLEFLMSRAIDDLSVLSFAYGLAFDLYLEHKHYKKCFECVEQAIQKSIDNFENVPLATKINALKEKDPKQTLQLNFFLVKHYDQLGQYDDLSAIAPSLFNTSYDYDVICLLSQAWVHQGKYKDAHKLLLDHLHKYPHDAKLHRHISEIRSSIVSQPFSGQTTPFDVGLSHMAKHQFLEAIDEFQKLSSTSPSILPAQALIVTALFELSRFNIAIDQSDKYLQQLDTGAEPQLAQHFMAIKALSNLHIGKPEQTFLLLQDIQQQAGSTTRFPLIESLMTYTKQWLQHANQPKTLSGCHHAGTKLYGFVVPNNAPSETSISFAQSQNNQGVDYFLQKNIKAAEQSFALAHKMDASMVAVCCNMALLNLAQHKIESTFEWLTKAEKIKSDFDTIYLNRGLCFLAQQEKEAAEHQFQRAVSLNPLNHCAQLHLADIRFNTKHLEKSLPFYELALGSGHLSHLVNQRFAYLQEQPLSASAWQQPLTSTLNSVIFQT